MRDSSVSHRRSAGASLACVALASLWLFAPGLANSAAADDEPTTINTNPPNDETVPSPQQTVPVPTLADPPVDEGEAKIVTPQGESITSGGSATLFTLQLPERAACPGDSASKNWFFQSFLIPAADDPGAIKYGVVGPEGTQFPLFAFDTRPLAHQLTQVSSTPDGPGVIPGLPGMNFAVFEPGYVSPGRYKIGIACTFWRQTARYWDTEIIFERTADDVPAELTWRLPDAAPFEPPSDRSTSRTLLIGGIVAALGAAMVLLCQSRTPSSPDGNDAPATSPATTTTTPSSASPAKEPT